MYFFIFIIILYTGYRVPGYFIYIFFIFIFLHVFFNFLFSLLKNYISLRIISTLAIILYVYVYNTTCSYVNCRRGRNKKEEETRKEEETGKEGEMKETEKNRDRR